MHFLPPSLIAFVYLHTTISASSVVAAHELASTYTLSSEITAIIPSCAQTCFESFVRANFPISVCTSAPTLDCLCSHSSVTSFTVGEGALQCIISEQNIGFCKGNDAAESVASIAYNMCTGRTNALPNTHATITATLVLQTSDPSIVLVAPTTTSALSSTAKATTSSSSKLTTVASSSSTRAASSTSSTLTTDTSISPTTRSSISVTAAPQASDTGVPAVTKLSTQQISAITAGSVGGAAFLVGAIFLCVCMRRRRKRILDYSSETSSFATKPPKNYPNGGAWSSDKNGPTRPQRDMTDDPNLFARNSQRPVLPTIRAVSPAPNAIGVAVSPETRHPSRLLPPKPLLTLQTNTSAKPERNGPNQNFSFPANTSMGLNMDRSGARYQRERESGMTQFEEDPDDYYPYSPDDIGYPTQHRRMGSTEPILPIAAQFQTQPQKRFQLQNNAGWQPQIPPRSFAGPADARVKPLTIRKSQQINQNPQIKIDSGYLQIQAQSQRQATRPNTAASSVYSQPGLEQMVPRPLLPSQMPRPVDSSPGWRPPQVGQAQGKKLNYTQNPNQNQYQAYQPYRPERPEAARRNSSGSITSIESQAAPPRPTLPRTPKLRTDNLTPTDSPVGKSPKGISPVTYPDPNSFGHPAYRRGPAPPQPLFVIPQTIGEGEKLKYRGPPVITGTMSTQTRKSRAGLQIQTQTQEAPPPLPKQTTQESRRRDSTYLNQKDASPTPQRKDPGLGLRLHDGDLDSRYSTGGNKRASRISENKSPTKSPGGLGDVRRPPLGDTSTGTGYVQRLNQAQRFLEPGERSAIELTPQKKGEQMYFTVA